MRIWSALRDLLAEFNPFDVLKIERRETQHSALLAWLLNPRGSHGLQDYFLRRFLSEAAAKAQEDGIGNVTALDVDGWDLGGIEVATERHNIDILLVDQDDEFVCIIENKIGAGEHSNQLARYLRIAEREYEGLLSLPHIPYSRWDRPQLRESMRNVTCPSATRGLPVLSTVRSGRGVQASACPFPGFWNSTLALCGGT